jgi:hypothetical protein
MERPRRIRTDPLWAACDVLHSTRDPIEICPIANAENRLRSAVPKLKTAVSQEMPSGAITESMTQSCSVWPRVCRGLMRRTRHWRVPPRWSLQDWWEEIETEIGASACHAIRSFDPAHGASLANFVYHTSLACVKSQYRYELSYAARCRSAPMREPD